MDLSGLTWDGAGLVTVVVQDRHDGRVRMVAHANEEALRETLKTGQAVFFSRSRNRRWRKGETSGNTMAVHEVFVDCDGDALVYLVDPAGPSCHTGRRTCFFAGLGHTRDAGQDAAPTLARLDDTLRARRQATGERSYTRSLLDAGAEAIGDKVREEADELARALAAETDERVVAEAADVLYHVAVGLLGRDLSLRDAVVELARRFGTSGHDEKRARG